MNTNELHNKTTGLTRNSIDKFYTNDDAVKLCMLYVKKYLIIDENDTIIEPSAGNGAFINEIKNITQNYKFYDLIPEHIEIVQQDFLTLDTSDFKQVHIIGNPPFGRQSTTAIKFVKKSCQFANSISFILPKSFKKDSMRNKFQNNFHLIFEIDLPENSFTDGGKLSNVPCIFQIWRKETIDRTIKEKVKPDGFIFVKKDENPDISFRRVGFYSGNVSKDIICKSDKSHYFIRFTNGKDKEDNVENLKKNVFQKDNTVGPRSISKPELIIQFNQNL
jgi:hypothetical protein